MDPPDLVADPRFPLRPCTSDLPTNPTKPSFALSTIYTRRGRTFDRAGPHLHDLPWELELRIAHHLPWLVMRGPAQLRSCPALVALVSHDWSSTPSHSSVGGSPSLDIAQQRPEHARRREQTPCKRSRSMSHFTMRLPSRLTPQRIRTVS